MWQASTIAYFTNAINASIKVSRNLMTHERMHLFAIEHFLVGMTRLLDENLQGDASHRHTTLVVRHDSAFNFKTSAFTILNIKKNNGNEN